MNLLAALALFCRAIGGDPEQAGAVLRCYTYAPEPPFERVEMP